MEQEKINNFVIAGIIAVLASVGINIIDVDSLDNVYMCSSTMEIKFFENGISGTGLTGYPNKDNRKNPTYCYLENNKIPWVQIEKYSKQNNIDLSELLQKPSSKNNGGWGDQYIVSNTGVEKI